MNNLEIFLCLVVVGLVIAVLNLVWCAGAEKPKVKAHWKIKQLPNTNWGIYHKGRFTRIWWKRGEEGYKGQAEAQMRILTNPAKSLYDSKGNTLL